MTNLQLLGSDEQEVTFMKDLIALRDIAQYAEKDPLISDKHRRRVRHAHQRIDKFIDNMFHAATATDGTGTIVELP